MSEHFSPFLITWEQKRHISGLCFINRLFISPRIRFVCLQSYLLPITCCQQLLEMSIFPQQSGSSWWAQSALLRHGICLCCVAEQQEIVASSQQVRGVPSLDLLPLHLCLCEFTEKRTCLTVPESLRSVNSQLRSGSSVHAASSSPATNQVSICLHFVHCASCTIHKEKLISYYISGFLRAFLLLLFFSSLLANLIFPPLSSLHQLSSFSHAPVGEHNTMAMAMLCIDRKSVV